MKTISLTQGKVALVDDADYDAVSLYNWHAVKHNRRFYAARNVRKPDGGWGTQTLHQFLMPGVAEIDHRDGNGLNNQRENLRPVTHQQNMQGFRHKKPNATSKFRGVSWGKKRQKWLSQIMVGGQRIFLGAFTKQKDAALAYNDAASKYFGESAQLNKI